MVLVRFRKVLQVLRDHTDRLGTIGEFHVSVSDRPESEFVLVLLQEQLIALARHADSAAGRVVLHGVLLAIAQVPVEHVATEVVHVDLTVTQVHPTREYAVVDPLFMEDILEHRAFWKGHERVDHFELRRRRHRQPHLAEPDALAELAGP
jgi:hypothetical protein